MNKTPVSTEQLQAFVDDQLEDKEKSQILKAIQTDPQLSRKVCELRTISELVKHAYAQPPASEPRTNSPENKSYWKAATAAVLLLGIGGVVGWSSHPDAGNPDNALNAMYWDNENAFHNSELETIAPQKNKRIIVHLNTSSTAKFESALTTAEQLLQKYADSNMDTEIEVVANASAIKMLRAGHSPFAGRVRDLQDQYFNLTFLACKDAIDHIAELEGSEAEIELLPDVDITPSALEHILERLKDGWVYINV
jgi:intracellular sulfur oxidation DsrE/DsrF family protein